MTLTTEEQIRDLLVLLNEQMDILVKEHLRHFKEWRESDERRNKRTTE